MEEGILVLLSVLLSGIVAVSFVIHIHRHEMSPMHGMVFAMALAMGVGLFAGALSGIRLQGDLLLSSLIGMGAGVIAGVTIGSAFSLLAFFEGVLSGVMAGMMGAMLGEMVQPEDWNQTIMIMFTIALFILFIVWFEIMNYVKNTRKWLYVFQNPMLLSLLFLIVCLFAFAQVPFFPGAESDVPHHH